MSNFDDNPILGIAAVIAGGAVIAAGVWKATDAIRDLITDYDKAEARKLYQKALQCEQQMDNNEAIRLFRESLKKDPTYSEAYNSIAWFYALRNLSLVEAEKLAISAFNFAQNENSKVNALNTLAEIQLRQNQFQSAIVNFQTSLKIQERIHSYYRLAYCYEIAGNTIEVYNSLKKAVNLQKDYYYLDLYRRIGDLCIELGRYNEALEHLNNASYLSNQKIVYGLTDWGYYYQIQPGEVLQIRQSHCLNSLGLAYYCLDDFHNSKIFWEASHQKFSSHPYPLFNLACLAARHENKQELRQILESLMPLIVDKSYAFDPPHISNKIISFSQHTIVEQILSQPRLEVYLDVVLEILWSYRKIREYIYRERLKSWSLHRYSKIQESKTYNLSIKDSNFGGISLGDDSNISSQISSKELTQSNRDLITNLPNEMDEEIKLIMKDYDKFIDSKQQRVSNNLTKEDISNTSLPSDTNTSKTKLNRST